MADITEQAKAYQTSNEISDDATATALREQNYKSYFNSQLQLAAAKARANKYYQDSVDSSGLSSSSGSSIAKAIMNNAYQNQANTNLGNYQTQEATITSDNATRYQEEQASKDSNFMTQLNTISQDTSTTYEQKQNLINKLLANYGYSDETMGYASKSALDTALQTNENNKYGTAYDQSTIKEQLSNWGDELSYAIKNKINGTSNPDNTVIELSNGNGELAYVYYNNGSYYVINQNTAKSLIANGANGYRSSKWGWNKRTNNITWTKDSEQA